MRTSPEALPEFAQVADQQPSLPEKLEEEEEEEEQATPEWKEEGKRVYCFTNSSSDELSFLSELSELTKSLFRAQYNRSPKTERLGPLNPHSGRGFWAGSNDLGYIMDPNPAHYNLSKEEGESSVFTSQLSLNSTRPITNPAKK